MLAVLTHYTPEGRPGLRLPVVTDECWFCQSPVDLGAQDTFTVSRVSGDSRYGYEPCHNACSAAIEAELAADS